MIHAEELSEALILGQMQQRVTAGCHLQAYLVCERMLDRDVHVPHCILYALDRNRWFRSAHFSVLSPWGIFL